MPEEEPLISVLMADLLGHLRNLLSMKLLPLNVSFFLDFLDQIFDGWCSLQLGHFQGSIFVTYRARVFLESQLNLSLLNKLAYQCANRR